MSVLRRTRIPYTNTEYLRKHPDKRTPAGSVPVSEPGVVKMQHLVGNQAVQRMIQRQTQAGTSAVLQRAPDKKEPASDATVLATIVLEHGGELKGESRIAGHEGKIELLSLNLENVNRRATSREDKPEERVQLTLTKYVDNLSNKLMDAIHKGDSIKSARFEFIRRDADGKVEVYHTLEYTDGYLVGQSVSGNSEGGKPLETVSVEFRVAPKK